MRNSLLTAAGVTAVALASSFASAGFTVTQTTTSNVAPGLDRIDIFGLNTGGTTGVQVKGVSLNFATTNGKKVYFTGLDTEVDGNGDPTPNGVLDTVDLFNSATTANKSQIRLNGTPSNNSYVGVTPSGGPVEPNAFIVGTPTFGVSVANLGSTNASSGTGFRFARLFVDTGAQGTVSGQIGGDIGQGVPYSVSFGAVINAPPVVTVTPPSLTIDVTPAGLEGGSAIVSANDPDVGGSVASLALVGSLPAQIADNVVISGPAAGPKTITISGLRFNDLGTYVLSFVATDNLGLAGLSQTFTLNIVPEPTTLGALAGVGLLALRRRK